MYKTTNSCFTVELPIQHEDIRAAKDYLTRNFGNIYNLTPHITLSVTPLPEYNSEKARDKIEEYFLRFRTENRNISLEIPPLVVDENKRFFYLKVENADVLRMHIELITLLDPYRQNHIREKDAIRIEQGYYTSEQVKNICRYGFARVIDLFNPHITIGSIKKENVDLYSVKKNLLNLLRDTIGSNIILKNAKAMYHTDANDQSKMMVFWEKSYILYPT